MTLLAVVPRECGQLVAILRQGLEPGVAIARDIGARRGPQRERTARPGRGTVDLESGPVGRVVLPRDIDPGLGDRDAVSVRRSLHRRPRSRGRCLDGRLDGLAPVAGKKGEQYERTG